MADKAKLTSQDLDAIEVAIENKVGKLAQSADLGSTKKKNYNPRQQADETRSDIARWFVLGQIFILPVILLMFMLFNMAMVQTNHAQNAIDIEKLTPLVTGFIASPIGFVLGYYFKSEEHKK